MFRKNNTKFWTNCATMKKTSLLFAALFLMICNLKAQVIVSDEYIMHDKREIITNQIQVPTTNDDIIVKLHLLYIKNKGIPAFEWAWFTIDFKQSTTGTISPYYYIIKTSTGKILQSSSALAKEVYSNVPKGWRRLRWHVLLEKKNLKQFTKEPVKKIRLAIGFGVQFLDMEFVDDSLTSYISKAHNAIMKQSKIKLDSSTNPSRYENF